MYNLCLFTVCVLSAITSSFAHNNFDAKNPNRTTNGDSANGTLQPFDPTNLNIKHSADLSDLKKRELYDTKEVYNTYEDAVNTVGIIGLMDKIGCTGTLVGPRHVLTAADCVYSRADNGFYPDIVFTSTKRENQDSHIDTETFETGNGFIFEEWQEDGSSEFNFAVLTLENAQSQEWMLLASAIPASRRPHNDGVEQAVEVIGFPGDKPPYTMWRSTGLVTEGYVKTDLTNLNGAAVFVHHSGHNVVYGVVIQSFYVHNSPKGRSVRYQAAHLDREKFEVICRTWINDPSVSCN